MHWRNLPPIQTNDIHCFANNSNKATGLESVLRSKSLLSGIPCLLVSFFLQNYSAIFGFRNGFARDVIVTWRLCAAVWHSMRGLFHFSGAWPARSWYTAPTPVPNTTLLKIGQSLRVGFHLKIFNFHVDSKKIPNMDVSFQIWEYGFVYTVPVNSRASVFIYWLSMRIQK